MVTGGRVLAVERAAGAKGAPPLDASDLLVLDNFVSCNLAIRCVVSGQGRAMRKATRPRLRGRAGEPFLCA